MSKTNFINIDARNQIREAIKDLDNHIVAGRKITEAIKANNKVTKGIVTANKLERLINRGIGTTRIEAIARMVGGQYDTKRDVDTLKFVLKKQLEGARKNLKEARLTRRKTLKEMKTVVRPGWRRQIIKNVIRMEGSRMWNRTKNEMKNSLIYLENKFKGGLPLGMEMFEDIEIGDDFIDDETAENEVEQEAIVIGTEATENQKAYLTLPKGMALFPEFSKESMYTDIAAAGDKLRMTLRDEEFIKNKETETEHNIWKKETEEELAATRVVDRTDRTVRFSRMRVTELKSCRRISVPDSLHNKGIENKIQGLVDKLEEVVNKEEIRLKKIKKDDKTTLTKEQQEGRKTILEEQKNKEKILLETDKSDHIAVVGPGEYNRMMEPHIAGDEIVTREDVEEAEKILSACAELTARILYLGNDHGHNDRVRSAMKSKNSKIPPLDALLKDHKKVPQLPVRGVCKARQSPNGILGDLVSDFLEAYVRTDLEDNSMECSSTEEMCAEIKNLNKKLETEEVEDTKYKEEEIAIGSFDVIAMYPELDMEECARRARIQIEESSMNIELDTDELALGLASMLNPDQISRENLTDVLPTRAKRMGTRPGIISLAVTGSDTQRKESKCWNEPSRKPNDQEIKRMLGIWIELLILEVMSKHYYMVGNEIRRQSKGGAIGIRLTGVLAHLFMEHWGKLFRRELSIVKIDVKMLSRYVDDLNQAMVALPLGSRLYGDTIEVSELGEIEDREAGLDRTQVTFNIAQQIGNKICKFIQLTVDTPGAHTSTYMPVLDLQVKTVLGGRRIAHKFYSKPVCTPYTILEKSAHSARTKFSTLTQECVRRLLNTNEYVSEIEKKEIMCEYNNRLRRSGYLGRYRQKVIEAAHKIYRKKCEVSESGGQPLYREKQWNREQRQIDKEMKRKHWYRNGKKGGDITHAPLILDPTHDRELKKKIQEVCDKEAKLSGIRLKVLERGGPKIKLDVKSNPLADKGCGRPLCLVCTGEYPGGCGHYGIVYSVRCDTCKQEGTDVIYAGESGSNAYNRGLAHKTAIQAMNPRNALAKHCLIEHNGEPADFTMRVLKKFRSCLMRQENEGVVIRLTQEEADQLMNSRREFNQPPIRRLVVLTGNVQNEQPGDEDGETQVRTQYRNRAAQPRAAQPNLSQSLPQGNQFPGGQPGSLPPRTGPRGGAPRGRGTQRGGVARGRGRPRLRRD
jgi:hypothetical protein